MQIVDISEFMNWFVNWVAEIFWWVYQTLDNIQFAGTSILGVCIGITLLGIGLPILLNMAINQINIHTGTSERIKANKENKKVWEWVAPPPKEISYTEKKYIEYKGE